MKRTNLKIAREGWYYLGMLGFIIAGAVIRDINLLYIMAGMMLGPILVSCYASTRALRRLGLRRRVEPLVAAGEPLYVEVTASKPKGSPLGLAIQVTDTIHRQGEARKTSRQTKLFYPVVRHDQPVTLSYCARLNQRGVYELGPLRASTGIPVGLVRAHVVSVGTRMVKVSPPLGQLQPAWSRTMRQKDSSGQESVRRRARGQGEFYGMREWRDGDSRNWIHWRTTAKRQKLTVRQFQQPVSQDLVVILDLYQPRNEAMAHETVEAAVSFVATLVAEQRKHGSASICVASASENSFVIDGTVSPVFYREVMERLAMVQADHRERLLDVLGDALRRATPNAKCVLVSLTNRNLLSEEFATLQEQLDVRRSLGDVLCVQAGSELFDQYFQSQGDGQDVRAPSADQDQAEVSA